MKHDLMAANVALTRKHWSKDFIKTCRALGMTDDEIKSALIKMKTATPTAPASETCPGQPSSAEISGRPG